MSRCTSLPALALLGAALLSASPAVADVTLLVPEKISIEAPAASQKTADKASAEKGRSTSKVEPSGSIPTDKAEKTPGTTAEAVATPPADAAIDEEVDLLITRMDPFRHEGRSMSMPQLFAVLRFDSHTPRKDNVLQPERRDLLGDVEEISYLETQAWAANVALDKPGLYQFIIETRPWWDKVAQRYEQHYVKSFLPVYDVEDGWYEAAGLPVEILPLARPFGLTAPCAFSGRVVEHGQPRAGVVVRAGRINTDDQKVPTHWHEELVVRTDERGQFTLVLPRAGWWCCMAEMAGTPLKGPDGDTRPLRIGSGVWFYVDSPDQPRQARPEKKVRKSAK